VIVIDTSAVMELVLNLPLAEAVRSRISDPETALHAPELLPLEVVAVLRRRVAAGTTTEDEALAALDTLDRLDIYHHGHLMLTPRVWALRDNLTASDAAFVALAELLDAPLLTADRRLAGAPGHRAAVDLVSR
jgi:predicted nucleic acid-binding protein